MKEQRHDRWLCYNCDECKVQKLNQMKRTLFDGDEEEPVMEDTTIKDESNQELTAEILLHVIGGASTPQTMRVKGDGICKPFGLSMSTFILLHENTKSFHWMMKSYVEKWKAFSLGIPHVLEYEKHMNWINFFSICERVMPLCLVEV